MNRPIRRVTVLIMVLFGLLFANGTYLMVFQQSSLNANPLNRRARDEDFAQNRGSILAGDTPIAYSKPSDDRFKYQRIYPHGKLYAPITGFFSYDHANTALEDSYNTQLAGTDDSLFVRRIIDMVTNQAPQGASVQTTIDPDVQKAAADALGKQKGAAVAINPKTGAVLAMVTSPSFDPNKIASHDISAADKAYTKLINDPSGPMRNRVAREIYPPGSTFKLVTAAAALEQGAKPDTMVASPDRLLLPGTTTYLYNENKSSCGGAKITLTRALDVSCNTAFAQLGLDLGEDKLREQAVKFGFDARHLDEVGGVASVFPDTLNQSELAQSAIGQYEVAATPLQMAMVSAAIANQGKVMEPYLVSSVRSPDLQVLSTTKPKEISEAMSPQNAKELSDMMVDVVQNGTGTAAQIPQMLVAGKTGTAQSAPDRKPYAWFTAFAPADDPQVAVAVMVEDADIPRQDIAGGALAAPIAKAMIEAAVKK
ncbi:penicillin-binding protein 2 [Microlunatus elymi]|uniref:Penicillin-binding protein 2 n=1 Tax=Microlunatus elymi TaxID=2596828 RepID=A0A516PVE6_9ACTN|nr:penicillin-binding protein 2 [Microlunatus elymi]QDP94921.1 penicillin-binding protein 2 [Microlunatus elymi]